MTRPLVLFLSLAAVAAVGRSADPPRPTFAVSVFDLGAVDQLKFAAADVASELAAQEWCDARPQPSSGGWADVPPGANPDQWVSVVAVGFGKRAEAYAFRFAGPHKAATLLAHVPHRKVISRGGEVWTSPVGRLAGAMRVAAPAKPLPLLHLEVTQAPTPKDEPLTLPPEKVLPPLKAVVTAAACAAGWAPTAQPADARATVEVRVHDQACSFRVVFIRGGRETALTRDRVPWEEFHDQLTRLLSVPTTRPAVADFVRPSADGVELLAVEKDRVVCVVDGELAALDAATGAEAWRLRVPQAKTAAAKKVERYAARRDADGRLRLFRWTTALAEVSPADGKLAPLAPTAASSATAFDVAANGDVALVQGNKLSLLSKGKEVWSLTESDAIRCGPRLEADRVLYGTAAGELVAVARADRRVLWRSRVGPRLTGPVAAAGPLRLVFTAEAERVAAVDPQGGAVKWNFATGDALVQPPLEADGAVVVVTKSNRLLRLKPETGAVLAEATWPTWVVAAEPLTVGGQRRLAVTDVAGRVALLDAGLKTVWETTVGARPTGRPAAAVMPAVWKGPKPPPKARADDLLTAIEADTVGTKPFLLATDAAGFLYKLTPGGTK